MSDLNRILFALDQSNCEDDMEFEEVKTRAAKKPGARPAFNPSRRVKFEGYAEADEAFVPMEVPSAINTLIIPVVSMSHEGSFALP
jgi:hypothetical protein